MKHFIVVAVSVLALNGCETVKTLNATGGSKSDGTVVMSYTYGMLEKPIIQLDAALVSATKRCKAWGYSKAEAFDSGNETCITYNSYGNCVSMRVDVTYQCLD